MNPTTFDKTRLQPIPPSLVQTTHHDRPGASVADIIEKVYHTPPVSSLL